MRVIRPKSPGELDWVFASHNNGAVSFALKLDRKRVKLTSMEMISLVERLPITVEVDGIESQPVLVVKLVCKPTANGRRRLGGKLYRIKRRTKNAGHQTS